VGDDSTNYYKNNPVCIGGKLTAGGWLSCALSGKYLALTGTNWFEFMEVMAYSQYFIHHKALSSTLSSTLATEGLPYFCEVDTNCKSENVMRSTLVIWNN
jgi:hypothetical protein